MLGALANPHRLRILAELSKARQYVSELARRLGMSRPLLHMHLKRLEAARLVFIWQIFATSRAKTSVAREEAYRALAEESAQAHQRTAAALEALTGELRSVRVRTDELERILKTVE